jgi:hypothetical protein
MFLSFRIGAAGNGSSGPSGYAGVGVAMGVGIRVAVAVAVTVEVGGNGVAVGDTIVVGDACVEQADKPVTIANRRKRTTKAKFDFMAFSLFSLPKHGLKLIFMENSI